MPEVKYRAWDTQHQWMTDVICLNLRDTYPEHILVHPKGDGIQGYNQLKENIVLRQFTGLCDKHGQEIYDGDVVKSWIDVGSVIFNYGMYFIHLNKPLQGIVPETQEVNFDWNDIEVIGNIYENPELLEVKE